MATPRPHRLGALLTRAAAAVGAAILVAGCDVADDRSAPDAPAAPASPAAEPEQPPGEHVFPMALAPVLDDPGRDAWQRPDEIVAALSIRPGQRIADVGCGTGYFTLRLLRATGATGHVLAVDVQQGMLDLLAGRLDAAQEKLVTLRRNPPDRPLEATDALDLVLCANTLYEVDETAAARFVKSMADGLAPGGRLAVVEWRPTQMRLGPPVGIRIAPARVRELAEKAGLSLAQDLAFLPMHSFLVFAKPR